MKKTPIEITVLRDFTGSIAAADIIEKVKRITRPFFIRVYDFQKKVYYYDKRCNKNKVTYKGKTYITFFLEGLGSCISVHRG